MKAIGDVIVIGCIVTVTVLLVMNRYGGSTDTGVPVDAELWTSMNTTGYRLYGPDSGAIDSVVVFTDFQCPACRDFNATVLSSIGDGRTDNVSVIIHHWPLPSHRYSMLAAEVFGCGVLTGQAQEVYRELYRNQRRFSDSLGSLIAGALPSSGSESLRDCLAAENPDVERVISEGQSYALEIGALGTPAVVVNGTMIYAANRKDVNKYMRRPL